MQADERAVWRGFVVQPGAPGAGGDVFYLGQTLPHWFRSILGGSVYLYGGYLFGGISLDKSVDLVGLGNPVSGLRPLLAACRSASQSERGPLWNDVYRRRIVVFDHPGM